jgi:hypothetical protein
VGGIAARNLPAHDLVRRGQLLTQPHVRSSVLASPVVGGSSIRRRLTRGNNHPRTDDMPAGMCCTERT